MDRIDAIDRIDGNLVKSLSYARELLSESQIDGDRIVGVADRCEGDFSVIVF